jgi:hypothetical protein
LYLYLTQPEKWSPEPLEFMGALSVTFGTAMHGFIQNCLNPKNANVLLTPSPEVCLVCGRKTGWGPKDCNEWGVRSEETRSHGHMDGKGSLPLLGWDLFGFEFKTGNHMKMQKIANNDIDAYRAKWPDYYAQNQDYLRITGLGTMVTFMLGLGYPWTMREFHVQRDEAYIQDLNTKYRSVIAHAGMGISPDPCCAPRSSKSRLCPAAAVCPIAVI